MLRVVTTGAFENPPSATTGTNYPPIATTRIYMLQVVATGAYHPPVATTGTYFAQNGEIRV